MIDVSDLIRRVAANVGGDYRLASVAGAMGVSVYQLHRAFERQTGETFAKFVERARLHQAAHALVFHDSSVLAIGLEHGYQSHETFTRAFRRRYGLSPSDFRQRGRWFQVERRSARVPGGDVRFRISASRIQRLRETYVLKVRRVGSYESVPDVLWKDLCDWLVSVGEPVGQCIGIGLDSPSEVPSEALRFDACVRLAKPLSPPAPYTCEQLKSGWYAVCTHVGGFDTLSEAYPTIYQQATELEGSEVIGLPAMEVYHGGLVDGSNAHNRTDVYLPLKVGLEDRLDRETE